MGDTLKNALPAFKKWTAIALAAALFIAAPGFPAYTAAAPVVAPVKVQARLGAPLSASGALRTENPGIGLSRLAPASSLTLGQGLPSVNTPASIEQRVESVLPRINARAQVAASKRLKESTAIRSPLKAPKRPIAVRSVLESHTAKIRSAYQGGGAGPKVSTVLRSLFSGFRPKRGAGVAVRGSDSTLRSRLRHSHGTLDRDFDTDVPAPGKPKSSFSRSWKYGLFAAGIVIALNAAIPLIAMLFGYTPHPNYAAPTPEVITSWLAAAKLMTLGVLIAPITEEILFRSGILGTLMWLGSKLANNSVVRFWIPALLSAAVFAVVHETADPVMFGVRLLGALAMAYVFAKEGIFASISLHFFQNLLALGVLIGLAMGGEIGAGLTTLGLGAAGLGLWIYSARRLWRQRADRKSGAVIPYKLTSRRALVLALIGIAAVVLVNFSPMMNLIWGLTLGALLLWAGIQKSRGN